MTTRPTFQEWISDVDMIMIKRYGLSHSDFPDWTWMDAYEDGLGPEEAVEGYEEEYADELGIG